MASWVSPKEIERSRLLAFSRGRADAAAGKPPRLSPTHGYMDGYRSVKNGDTLPFDKEPAASPAANGGAPAAGPSVVEIELLSPLLLANEAMRGNWHKTARATKELRERSSWLWREELAGRTLAPPVSVEVFHTGKGKLPDAGAAAPTAKAAIDGLVDSGGLTDDSYAHVSSVRFWAPRKGKTAAVLVRAVPLRLTSG